MLTNDYYLRLRIPETMRRQLLKSATLNNRSMTAEILTRLQRSLEPGDRLETASEGLKVMKERLSSLEEQFRLHIEKTSENYPSNGVFRIAGE
ncbi:Arc family DNA-binding protein [Rhizobium sp. LjRoot30]|uniref:Arc family DNA-binding protein n=1 Tax=Rhizobium sp. LjRoot30 TaxID=3342320 RepID=UPI003ECC81FA